ncbi:glycosyltransferase family 9 protein [Verrucomicrobiota bacterium sgz303538]
MTKPRILVIRGGAIGDFILTLPAIKLLREAFPNAHLEIMGYQHIIALAEDRFYADATRSIEYGAMAGFFIPNGTLVPELAEYFGGFQQIVSFLFDPDGIFENNLKRAGAKNVLKAYYKIDDSEHAARQLARPLQQLALYLDESGATVYPSDDDRLKARQLLTPVGERPLIALHPGSGSGKKNWSVENWAELAGRLLAAESRPMLALVGGEADRDQIATLSSALDSHSLIQAQDLPLPVLAAVFEQCRLFLGHDSGISHLAAAVETPCVLLFGPTDPSVWAPVNDRVTVLEAPEGDLTRLELNAVWDQISGRL